MSETRVDYDTGASVAPDPMLLRFLKVVSDLPPEHAGDVLRYVERIELAREGLRAALQQIAAATGHDDGYCVDCAAVLADIARQALGMPLRRPDLP